MSTYVCLFIIKWRERKKFGTLINITINTKSNILRVYHFQYIVLGKP